MEKGIKRAIVFIIAVSLILAGCNNDKSKEATAKVYAGDVSTILISEKDDFFSPEIIRDLEKYLQQGETIHEGLQNSGIVTFADDGAIRSISQVSLSPAFVWGLELNKKKLGKDKLDTVLKDNDEIGISIEPTEQRKSDNNLQFTVLKLNGGSIQPGISHTYILPYVENQSVRDMLLSTDFIKLSMNKRFIDTVKGYSPKSIEKWVIKVNSKELVENGLDMKLTPQDEVEIRLDRS
ncbi:hypothetical protein J23TS9_04640 [Paenibacillus sp. J23TS9]|uniref:hypothetical protein n=1 Tax=Paenibacillus sp. J23TS9 TaxID=2807193 RepID=UPI001B1B1BF0|nr:hypothetical protein [Paenibacillus sp. J23TS9]GIP25334.1 hypothetical protein J23TS9_04640 [Paenibacillus sp. J23TS9]